MAAINAYRNLMRAARIAFEGTATTPRPSRPGIHG
jgi:hypothetical protein